MPSATFNEANQVFVIPAQHTNRLRSILKGQQAAPAPLDRVFQQVFTADYREVRDVPASRITHLGNDQSRATRLVLCANYDPAIGPSSCSMGARCKFVHADLRDVPVTTHRIHINYAYRDLESVTYPRYSSGSTLHVHAPAAKGNFVDVTDSGSVLRTAALECGRTPLCHCAHYYFNRTCNLGPKCQFIHAVFIDPTAKPFQRAPAPRTLGRRAGATSSTTDGNTNGGETQTAAWQRAASEDEEGAVSDEMTETQRTNGGGEEPWIPSHGSFSDVNSSQNATPHHRRRHCQVDDVTYSATPALPCWGPTSAATTPGAGGASMPSALSSPGAGAACGADALSLNTVDLLDTTLASRTSTSDFASTTMPLNSPPCGAEAAATAIWSRNGRRFRHNPYGTVCT